MKLARLHTFFPRLVLLLLLTPLQAFASQVNFYGHGVSFADYTLPQVSLKKVNETSLTRLNNAIKQTDVSRLSQEIKHKQRDFNLDDLGMLKLLDQRLAKLYTDHNRRTLLKWRILSHLKYDVLLTYSNDVVDCFGTMNFKPLENVYILRKNKRYNNLNFSDKRTYGNRFIFKGQSAVGRKLVFDSRKRPRIFNRKKSRTITFTYKQQEYSISAEGNGSLMEYYNDLPAIDFSKSYLHNGFSQEAKNSVILELKNITADMNKRESIGLLLKFVQSAFPYKSDYDNHGREKYNFPEETLFEKYSDCEDRTLLLAGLVREILDLNSVALYFEKDEHMSLAIEMSEYKNSYSFKYDEKLFVACEPTGRNYRFGQSAIALERVTRVYKLY